MKEKFTLKPYGDKPYHTGTAIPVFSLRTEQSAGTGEFLDLKPFADFLQASGMDVMQLLPINDNATFMDWRDSYPYRSISIFALNPLFFAIEPFVDLLTKSERADYEAEKESLNTLDTVDYERALALKWRFVRLISEKRGAKDRKSKAFEKFIEKNDFWLKPYSAFCYLRDSSRSSHFEAWEGKERYSEAIFDALTADKKSAEAMGLTVYMQFLLHQQLTEAVAYCHKLGIALKGDIGIGIAHDSADAWATPELFHMDKSAGAPPDVFSEVGQNWGFPTYNWEKMAEDGYDWWKKRMSWLSQYVDAYRLDHILGFFRIWEIPNTAVRALLGQFSPALALTADEIENYYGIPLRQWGVSRFTEPFIKDWVIDEIFGRDNRDAVIQQFLDYTSDGNYRFKAAYDTQRKVENAHLEDAMRDGLYKLHENVIFIADSRNPETYHPRIKVFENTSFREFGDDYKQKLMTLYNVYYYQRNFDFWKEEAYKKLPVIKNATEMLACGEDLGMVPENVPDVMYQLEILRLIIERMPADDSFVSLLDYAPYLSVVTTSSHDTSTLRGWWEEDASVSQRYYNDVMHWYGEAPREATPEIVQEIVKRHLNANAMIVSLPLQDWLALTADLRREDVQSERINQPDIPFHYWRYRMHLTIEKLNENQGFTNFLHDFIQDSRRSQTTIE